MSFERITDQPHPITEKYTLDFLGQGAENLVYSVRNRPSLVFKGNKLALAKTLHWNAKHGEPLNAETEGVNEVRTTMLAKQREAYMALRRYFGSHVPVQHQYVMEVPYNTSVLDELQPLAESYDLTIPSEGRGSGWTVVTAQRRVPEMRDMRRVSLRWSPVQESQPLSHMLSEERSLRTGIPVQQLEQKFRETPVGRLLERAASDTKFAEALADFQRRAVQYANASQTILDLVGNDNVLFAKGPDAEWNYVLVDALFPFGDRILERARHALTRNSNALPHSVEDREAVLQAISFVRTINALGAFLKTGAFIELLPNTPTHHLTTRGKLIGPLPTTQITTPRMAEQPQQTSTKRLFGPIPNFKPPSKKG